MQSRPPLPCPAADETVRKCGTPALSPLVFDRLSGLDRRAATRVPRTVVGERAITAGGRPVPDIGCRPSTEAHDTRPAGVAAAASSAAGARCNASSSSSSIRVT